MIWKHGDTTIKETTVTSWSLLYLDIAELSRGYFHHQIYLPTAYTQMLFISKNTPCYRMSYHLCVPILIPLHRYGTLIASSLSLFCIIQLFFLFLMETCSFYLSYGLLDPNISFPLTCQQNYLECLHSLSSNPLITFFLK